MRGGARRVRGRRPAGLTALFMAALVAGGCATGGRAAAPTAPTAGGEPQRTPASSLAASAPTIQAAPAEQAVPTVAPSLPAPAPPVSVILPNGLVLRGDGRTAPGPYFLGRIDAPVALEEYGDYQ